MRPSRPLVAVVAGAALGLLACGGDAPAPRCTPRASPSPPAVSAGHLTAVADRLVVPTGGSVALAVRVAGPFSFDAPCAGPVSLIVIDRTDIHVDSSAPAAPKGTPCGAAVTLGAGQTAEYDLAWNADPTLPPGPYRLVLGLGDQPQLVLTVRLGVEFGSGCG